MTGVQHKRMGVAAGLGVLAYTVLKPADPTLALCMCTAPFGAMLPDIDHDQSKLGRNRKTITGLVKAVVIIAVIAFLGLSFYSGGLWPMVMNAIYVGLACLILKILASNKAVSRQLGFITKHRGIMHTLVPPVVLMGSCMWCTHTLYVHAVLGLCIGYVVHLIGDMATVDGAPVAWPLTKRNIRYFKLNSSKHAGALNVASYVWSAIFIAAGVMLGVS